MVVFRHLQDLFVVKESTVSHLTFHLGGHPIKSKEHPHLNGLEGIRPQDLSTTSSPWKESRQLIHGSCSFQWERQILSTHSWKFVLFNGKDDRYILHGDRTSFAMDNLDPLVSSCHTELRGLDRMPVLMTSKSTLSLTLRSADQKD